MIPSAKNIPAKVDPPKTAATSRQPTARPPASSTARPPTSSARPAAPSAAGRAGQEATQAKATFNRAKGLLPDALN